MSASRTIQICLISTLLLLGLMGAFAAPHIPHELKLPRIGPLTNVEELSDEQLEVLLQRVRQTVRDNKENVEKIADYILKGDGQGQAYSDLAEWTDTFGSRISGSSSHYNAIVSLKDTLIGKGLENVHLEAVKVPKWVRGQESARLLSPRDYDMNILGLGNSIGCENITAEAIVVGSFDDLSKMPRSQTEGKIIVFNQYCDWENMPIQCYSMTGDYRTQGANHASRAGGVAALIRTVGAFSINSPHTGIMFYESDVKQIPAACITIEDAEMFQRMQDRGNKLVLSLSMDAKPYDPVVSYNLVADFKGDTYPEELVLVSGHLDSWDVGQGAMDDGGGAFISWQALNVLNQLSIRPKRTMRFVGWACEEFGGVGSKQYYEQHKSNASLYDLVLESDLGVFRGEGIKFTGSNASVAVMQEVMQALAPYNLSLLEIGGGGEDIGPWMEDGVPGGSLVNANQRYFWFHHSHGDMMTVLDAADMDLCVLVWTVTSYLVASLDDMLPRNKNMMNVHPSQSSASEGYRFDIDKYWVKGKHGVYRYH